MDGEGGSIVDGDIELKGENGAWLYPRKAAIICSSREGGHAHQMRTNKLIW